MPTWIILGHRGSGKNLFLTIMVLLSPLISFSNCKIKSGKYRPLTILGLYDLPEYCNIILDEAYAWIDARSSQKTINKHLSYLNFQLRKTKRDIFLTAQDQMSIDVRFRRIWDYLVICERVDNGNPDNELWDFQYTLFIQSTGFISSPKVLPYNDAKRYFEYFDTYEMVDIPERSKIEYELLKSEPIQYLTRASKMAVELKKSLFLNSYTIDDISLGLLALGYDEIWTKIVHKIINKKITIERILS